MKLNNKNISQTVEKIEKFFESADVSKKDKIKICFLLEESLLRYQEKFGDDYEFNFVTKKWFGTPKILIKIKGTPYNPIEDNSEEQIFTEDIIKNLLNYEKAEIIYKYNSGCNEISAFIPKKIKNLKIPGGSITISIFFAIFSALIAREIFSEETQNIFINHILTPILNTLLGALIAVNLPLIFISIVASICAIEDVAMLNNVGSKILKRFFVTMFFIAFLSIFVCSLFFPVVNFEFGEKFLSNNLFELQQLFNLILSIIPQDIFQAFIDKNILQVMTLAFVTGICIIILGEKATDFKNLIISLKYILFKMVSIVFKLIPLIISLFIFKTILIYSASEILIVWKLIAVKYILFTSITFVMLLKISFKYDVKILDFLKKIYPACVISFKTASGVASLQKNLEVCKKNLKIEENLCDFYIPLSHTLCPTTLVTGIVANIFFSAYFSGNTISIAQLIIIAFLAVQFAISAVGGNGGMVATMTLLLTQMEFSVDSIGAITVSDIFVINFSILSALIIRDCDLFDCSHKIQMK